MVEGEEGEEDGEMGRMEWRKTRPTIRKQQHNTNITLVHLLPRQIAPYTVGIDL
jgi:hypothetical protein